MTALDQPELLFFDTFSHDTNEELNLDLVQFPKSVYVREIRIIPLGARVEGDFPGGVRLGATNPTKFHIDFFVNDLSKPGASTFESLGSLDYCQNGQIHMECSGNPDQMRIPTDGLVLKGLYTTITLAVYGNLSQVAPETPPIVTNVPPPTIPKQALPREVPPVPAPSIPQPAEWTQEAPNPIPTYTGQVATVNPEVYTTPNYPPENYDNQIYRSEYYDPEAPKDPRQYHDGPEWEKDRRVSPERELSRQRDSPRLDLDRERRDGRGRRRSLDRRSRDSSRHRDRSRDLDRIRSRTRSRDRDYIVKGEYRRLSRSRSRSIEGRLRSSERDWDRSSYKKEDYRRHRDTSYDRSRGGSYERRTSPYDKRAPSYERKRLSPFEKRGSSYERRAPSYEKQYDKKRHSPYNRLRGSSYSSRSPSRDDPRKRPKSPPTDKRPISPREGKTSPTTSIRSDAGDYDRSGKQIPRVEFYHQSYRHKAVASIRSPSQEPENPPFVEPQHSSLVTVPIVDNPSPAKRPIESPVRNADEDKSMDVEQFEPILSDEDICDDLESSSYMAVDYDVNEYCGVDDIIKYYNPFKDEWVQYENVNKVHLLATVKRENTKDVMTATFDELCDASPDLFKISELTKTSKGKYFASTFTEIDNVSQEDWVHQCEQIYVSLTNLCKNTDIILRIFRNHCRNEEPDEFQDMYNVLISYTKIGLSFEAALSQQQPTYKIRHMKCGIRLAEALFSHRHNGVIMKMLLNTGLNIPMQLLEMYCKEYMALSMRLMILKSLNASLSSKESLDHFMQDALYPKFDKNDDSERKPKNGYQALIAIMQTDPLVRIKFSISALIKKLNMYELLGKLHELVQKFNKNAVESTQPEDVEMTEKETEFIVDALEEILYMFRNQCFHISQPKRFLPVSAQFEINKDCSNETLLEFFNTHRILEVCLYLLTCPMTCNNIVVISPIHDLIYELIYSQNGLNFLYRNMEMSELIFKILVQPYGQQNMDDYIYPHDISNYTDLQIIGFELAYRLKAMYYLESICDLQAGKVDENELIDRLQSLYCLSFGSIGKVAVSDIIVMGDNAECLMEVFERDLKSKSKNDSPSKQKSPAKGYAIELIVLAVRFSTHVPFLKKYGPRILNVAKEHDRFEPSVSSVLQEVVPYLKPVEKTNLVVKDDMAECVEILKNSAEHAPDLPGELITSLRILRHFCISDYDSHITVATESVSEEYVELKYKYNVLQLFSLDGVALLAGILDKICAHFEQPSTHTSFFASSKGLQLAQVLLPCLRLLDEMLSRVVRCRGARFRDLTAAPVILKTYAIAKAFPVGCVGHRTAGAAAEAAVRALLAYSQPAADDEAVRRGPRASLCAALLDYTMTAPYTFASGLSALSELLPLPLPLQARRPPSGAELAAARDSRRLWAAHLHAQAPALADLIGVVGASASRPAARLLRRVCLQVADLAPLAAAAVARAAGGAAARAARAGAGAAAGAGAGAGAARALALLACLLQHAPVKCAVLHAPGEVPGALCAVLRGGAAGAAAQEWAAHALAGLCDAEVTLAPPSLPPERLLADSLPNKETLALLLDATADCLASSDKTAAVASSVLRAYFVLTEHEYGFHQFKKFAARNRESLRKFFEWTLEDSGEDRLECLSLYLDLIRILKVEEGEGAIRRKSTLSASEMADMVGYSPTDTDHPVLNLENILKERNVDEEVLTNSRLLGELRAQAPPPSSPPPGAAPPAPPSPPPPSPSPPAASPAPLVEQFASRVMYSLVEPGDERLTASYWLSAPAVAHDDDVNESELVPCDIMDIALRCLPPEPAGAAGAGGAGGVGGAGGAGGAAARRTNLLHDRPAGVGGATTDAFRSRPPNTSRPPSLHVDDFTRALALQPSYCAANRGLRRAAAPDRGRFASGAPSHHAPYRLLRGRGAWDMGGQHFGHFPPTSQYMMGMGGGWGGGRMQRGPRHRSFMRN